MKYHRIHTFLTGRPWGYRGGVLKPYYRAVIYLIPVFIMWAPMPVSAQISSNEINYFSRCRQVEDDSARAACYDDLYDRALRAVTPRAEPGRLLEDNRRMREELARIRQRTGSAPGADQPRDLGGTARYPASSRAEEFGRTERHPAPGKAEDFGKKAPTIVKNDDDEEQLFDRIAALQKTPDGWIITLESGQVWRQMVGKRYNLREGQEVKISPAIWGDSFHLSVSKLGGFIQVRRVK